MPTEVTTRITSLFSTCKAEGRKAFIPYITGGDPTPAQTASLVLALERGGADLIELGVPFSDPNAHPIERYARRAPSLACSKPCGKCGAIRKYLYYCSAI
jgi:hypothetical protein